MFEFIIQKQARNCDYFTLYALIFKLTLTCLDLEKVVLEFIFQEKNHFKQVLEKRPGSY